MIRNFNFLTLVVLIFCCNLSFAESCQVKKATPEIDKEIAYIRYQIAVLEHEMPEYKKAEKIKIRGLALYNPKKNLKLKI